MSDTFTCPNCTLENAYFDTRIYYCPNCDYEWNDNHNKQAYEGNPENPIYKSLILLKEPFFRLIHAKVYMGNVDHDMGTDLISFIPLAFKPNKNQQFILIDAENLIRLHKNYIEKLFQMDFDALMNVGEDDDFPDFGSCIIRVATKERGILIDYYDSPIYDITEL